MRTYFLKQAAAFEITLYMASLYLFITIYGNKNLYSFSGIKLWLKKTMIIGSNAAIEIQRCQNK